jgi:hypothetical protein
MISIEGMDLNVDDWHGFSSFSDDQFTNLPESSSPQIVGDELLLKCLEWTLRNGADL